MAKSRATSLLPLILLLAGCPVYGPQPVQREVQLSCQSDFDCPLDTFCDFETNSCIAYDFEICVTDGDCPVGSYCERSDGGCYIPAIAECSADRDCSSGFECDFRDSCRPETDGTCLADGDCAIDALCIENLCTAVGETCQFDFQCSAGFTCTNNRCRLLCGPDTICPSGTACEESLCQPIVGECIDSSQFPDLETNCVEGTCLRRCDAGCDATIEVCDAEGFCRPRTSPDAEAPSPFCRTDADCDGSLCVQGLCRTACDITVPEPDAICASYDGQVPLCGPDNLCYAESEMQSDCRVQSECPDGEDCVDGKCR